MNQSTPSIEEVDYYKWVTSINYGIEEVIAYPKSFWIKTLLMSWLSEADLVEYQVLRDVLEGVQDVIVVTESSKKIPVNEQTKFEENQDI